MSGTCSTLFVAASATSCLRCGGTLVRFAAEDATDIYGRVQIAPDGVVGWCPGRAAPAETITSDVTHVTGLVSGRAVWTSYGDVELLCDPAIAKLADRLGVATHVMSLACVYALWQIDRAMPMASTTSGRPCFHAYIAGDRVGSVFTLPSDDPRKVGLLHIVDVPEQPISARATAAGLPISLDLLEAKPAEPTLSLAELDALEAWEPGRCDRMRPARPWLHLILVSHRWGHPTVPSTPLAEVKRKVREYVTAALEKAKHSPDDRVKVRTEGDFGIWLDYMLVPNDVSHELAPIKCQDCRRIKTELIIRINALLTVASVVAMSVGETDRGWILQEMSLDKHGVTPYEHRDRVSLMAQHVEFGKPEGEPGGLDIDDSLLLRCSEFVRLALTPRTWPAVNEKFIDELEAAGHKEESTSEAWEILMKYARAFEHELHDCHRLKRLMAQLPQAIALAGKELPTELCVAGSGTFEDPLDLQELDTAVRAQGAAMMRLGPRIEQNAELLCVGGGTQSAALEERVSLTARLQWQQLVAAGMGLRAELQHDGGLGSWLCATSIVEALGGVKFMARMKEGRVAFGNAASVTTRAKPRTLAEQLTYARDVALHGVPLEELETVYGIGQEFRAARWRRA